MAIVVYEAISPDQVVFHKRNMIPPIVIRAVNILLTECWNGVSCCINQDDLVEKIIEISDISSEQIFENNYLDFEAIYRNVGWTVDYSPHDCKNGAEGPQNNGGQQDSRLPLVKNPPVFAKIYIVLWQN